MLEYQLEIEKYLTNLSEDTGIDFEDLEDFFWNTINTLRPKPYQTLTSLIHCKNFEDIIIEYKKRGREVSRGAVYKQARRALLKIFEAFNKKYGRK